MTTLLVDTDVFAKLGIAGLLGQLCELFDLAIGECGRLPALTHMLRRGGLPALYGKDACERLLTLADSMLVAPSASTKWLAPLANVPQIDPGEAQLFACAAEHSLIVVTGDKRSVIALSKVEGIRDVLRGRIASMESVLLALCRRHGREHVRSALKPLVTIDDRKDKMLRVCFSDGNPDPESALQSYITDLKRNVAPLVLWEPAEEVER